jgi:murein DD-endopeptidase MepM/ murein hydrolase activator NlpD
MSTPPSPRARRRLGWLLMAAGAAGAVVAGALAVAADRSSSHPAHATGSAAVHTPAVVVAHGTPPPMLSLRPRLTEGSVLARISLPGTAKPLTVLEGTPARVGLVGHDSTTAYPGEPHSMLLEAGPGLSPAAPPAGSVIEVAATYGVYRYRVLESHLVTASNGPVAQVPGLRLLVGAPEGERMTTAELLADDPATQAELAQETAVAEAQAALAAQPSGIASGHLLWPCSGPLTQGFGPTSYGFEFPYVYQGVAYPHFHTGVDIGVASGTPIGAAAGGVVVLAGTNVVEGRAVGYGTYVVIAHGGGLYTLYGHLSRLDVVAGERVSAGQQIGLSGSTGNSTGPHLHFEVRQVYQPVDPLPYLQ